ncbi:MAG: SDR family NAD(P)-dependent oxidoreductase [Ignavibacteria bacterium]
MELQGKNIILTGASSGIGYALAEELAKENCNLALISRRKYITDELSVKLKKYSGKIISVECDVSSKSCVSSACDIINSEFERIDAVILNSGTGSRTTIENFNSSDAENVFGVNVMGIIYFIEKLLPGFIKRKEGMIIGVSSISDVRGFPGSGLYPSSKAAATNFLESLRVELRKYNVKVLTVRPGFVKTPMTDKNEFYMPFLMDVHKAAVIIIKGIKKEKKIIEFPFPTILGSKLIKIMPVFLFDFLLSRELPKKKIE